MAGFRAYPGTTGTAVISHLGGIMVTRISSRTSIAIAIIAAILGLLGAPAAAAPARGSDILPEAITAGPDGNMWFTESGSSAKGIGRITPAGDVTEFSVPGFGGVHRWAIAAGSDGNLWFTQAFSKNGIGRITPAGVVTEYPMSNATPTGIAAGPDGDMWWASAGRIGKMGLTGALTEFPVPDPAGYNFSASGIAAGPDGNMWFTLMEQNRIGRITPDGLITEFALPTAWSRPARIAAGPDGNMWFTENSGNRIGRITPAGAITEYPLPTANGSSHGIAAGPDGNMWFTEPGLFKIGRITPTGTITEYQLYKSGSNPNGIAAGPDGNMWFTEPGGNRVGRITMDGAITEYDLNSPAPTIVKTPCPVDATVHRPTPTTVGNHVLTDRITTTSTCLLRKPVALCRPLASTTAGKKTFCNTKVTPRGKIRVHTSGYTSVRVTVIARAIPKTAQADSWKPDTWRKTWVLGKRTAAGKPGETDLALSQRLVQRMEAAGVDITAIRGATLRTSGVVTFRVIAVKGDVITHKGGLRFSSSAGSVTLQDIAVNSTTGKATARVETPAVPGGIQITDLLSFTGGDKLIKQKGTWTNAKVTLARSTSVGDPAPLFASQLSLPAGSIASGMTIGKATITLKR